jgi:NTE family protein
MSRLALVLAGGAARGAYEVGVALHLLQDVARDLGRDVPIDILSGTSVGAINASLLAAFADEPRMRATRLAAHWTSLKVDEIVHADGRGVFNSLRSLFGGERRLRDDDDRRGGILNPDGIERLVQRAIPFERIRDNLRHGRLEALTLSATHVGSGKTVVFVEGARFVSTDPTVTAVPAVMRAEHALASAAIPFVFPAVRIDGDFYVDGGLRQNVPLAPALRLGAEGLIVVNPRHVHSQPPVAIEVERERKLPGAFFLLGKALNALLLDHIENDVMQMERINRILEAGVRAYGPDFVDRINGELGVPSCGPRMRPVRTVFVSASEDIGRIAAEYVRTPTFAKRVGGVAGRVMRRIADGSREADLLSYLLFDGEFAGRLIELGRADARARHDELCALVESLNETRAAA